MGYYSLDLDELRQAVDGPPKTPFPHQQEAFEALAEAYSLDGIPGELRRLLEKSPSKAAQALTLLVSRRNT